MAVLAAQVGNVVVVVVVVVTKLHPPDTNDGHTPVTGHVTEMDPTVGPTVSSIVTDPPIGVAGTAESLKQIEYITPNEMLPAPAVGQPPGIVVVVVVGFTQQ